MTFDKSTHPGYKEITLGELADAIEKNGLPKFKSSFYDIEEIEGEPIHILAACALGQAAINLDASANSLFENINELFYADLPITSEDGENPFFIGDYIVKENDRSEHTLQEIAANLRERISKSKKYSLNTKVFVKKNAFKREGNEIFLS